MTIPEAVDGMLEEFEALGDEQVTVADLTDAAYDRLFPAEGEEPEWDDVESYVRGRWGLVSDGDEISIAGRRLA